MLLFRFEPSRARELTAYDAVGVSAASLLRLKGDVVVNTLRYRPEGTLGEHPAGTPQLFVVVEGEGWVSGAGGGRRPIRAGEVAFWKAGEPHASGSESGMTALAVQSPGLDPLDIEGLEHPPALQPLDSG